MSDQSPIAIPDEDRLRADFYNYLGVLLASPPSQIILDQTAALSGDDSELGVAINAMAAKAAKAKVKNTTREFNALFIGLGRGELLPFASFYLTGFLHEKPLAALRGDMVAQGLTRAADVFEPEDGIASLMEMMGAMIIGRFGPPAPLDAQMSFFNKHIAPWAGHFFDDLTAAEGADFYAPVGRAGRAFIDIEREAFRLMSQSSSQSKTEFAGASPATSTVQETVQ